MAQRVVAEPAAVVPNPPAEDEGDVAELRQLCARANRAFQERSFKRAVRLYSLALEMSQRLDVPSELRAVIFHNRACSNLQRPGTRAFGEAVRDAERAKSFCRPTERAQYDLALMMVRNKDNRLQPDFKWYPDQTLGNRRRDDPVAKRLTIPAPHTARHATLRPETILLPRLALTARPSEVQQRDKLRHIGPTSPPYAHKDYKIPTPRSGADTSIMDRESRRIATEIATQIEYEKAVEEYAQRDAAAAKRRAGREERDSVLMLDLSVDGDALLRSVTPELDILTPAVVREGLVRQTSKQVYNEMKAKQMETSVVAENPNGEQEENSPGGATLADAGGAAVRDSEVAERPAD